MLKGIRYQPFYATDDDGGGGDPPKPIPDPTPVDPLASLTDAQKALIKTQVDAAAAAARKAGEKAGMTQAQQDHEAKLAAERTTKEQADLVKAGEFDKAKTALEGERDTAKADAKTASDKLERAQKRLDAVLKDRITELEALKDDELLAEFKAITDPLDQLEWFDKASTKRALAAASEDAKVTTANGKPKVPRTPTSNTSTAEAATEAELLRLRRKGNYGSI